MPRTTNTRPEDGSGRRAGLCRTPRPVSQGQGELSRIPTCLSQISFSRPAQARIAQIDAERGVSPSLVDSFHRRHNYLRISLTERCNLRCACPRIPHPHGCCSERAAHAVLAQASTACPARASNSHPTERSSQTRKLCGSRRSLYGMGLRKLGSLEANRPCGRGSSTSSVSAPFPSRYGKTRKTHHASCF